MLPAGGHVMQSQDNMVLPVGLGIVFVEWSGVEGEVEVEKADKNTIVKLS
jgi:hypothetical protein